jgi:fluoride exporter
MSVGAWLAVGVLGAIGSLARFAITDAVTRRTPGAFPYGTLLVNLSGSFVLGVLAGAKVGDVLTYVVGGGLLGAFTTFSTWMVDSERLVAGGDRRGAVLNVAGSLAAGVLLAAAGFALGRAL